MIVTHGRDLKPGCYLFSIKTISSIDQLGIWYVSCKQNCNAQFWFYDFLCQEKSSHGIFLWQYRATVGSNSKFPPKMRFKKFVKMTDHTCSCNDLTNFWYETRNERKWKLFEYAGLWFEKLMKSLWVNLFLAGFSHLEPLCALWLGLAGLNWSNLSIMELGLLPWLDCPWLVWLTLLMPRSWKNLRYDLNFNFPLSDKLYMWYSISTTDWPRASPELMLC